MKPAYATALTEGGGRPFTGAWIETCWEQDGEVVAESRPFTGAWIETLTPSERLLTVPSRPFTGAWIETL